MRFPSRLAVLSALVLLTDPRPATTTPHQAAGRTRGGLRRGPVFADARPEEVRWSRDDGTGGGRPDVDSERVCDQGGAGVGAPCPRLRWWMRGGCRRLYPGLGLVLRGGEEEDAMDESGDGEEEDKVPPLPIGDEVPPWRHPRGKSMVYSVTSHANATSIGWHLWEIDLRFSPGLPPGWSGACFPTKGRPLLLLLLYYSQA